MQELPQEPPHRGDDAPGCALDLLPLVYQELRQLAARKLARESPSQTLQPTALVHEAWLRLADATNLHYRERNHFFAIAAEAMRRILIERARSKRAACHGGGAPQLPLEQIEIAAPLPDDTLLALDEALERLAQIDPVSAELVKLRFFVGLKHEEAAQVLGISRTAADRAWVFARLWLYKEIQPELPGKKVEANGPPFSQ